jgi:serine/threonine protein kinase
MYAMCTGRPPFRADTTFGVLRRITDTEARPIRETNADIPAWLANLVDKLLAKDPSHRFASAAEAAATIEQCLAHVQQPAAVPLPASIAQIRSGGQAARRPRRPTILLAAALAAFLAASAAVYFGMTGAGYVPTQSNGSLTPSDSSQSGDEHPSALEWNSAAEQIHSLSTDVDALQQRADQLWDRQPILEPPAEASPPADQPHKEFLP